MTATYDHRALGYPGSNLEACATDDYTLGLLALGSKNPFTSCGRIGEHRSYR